MTIIWGHHLNFAAEYNYWGSSNPNENDLFAHPEHVMGWENGSSIAYTNKGAGSKIAIPQYANHPLKEARMLERNGAWEGALAKYYEIIEMHDDLKYRRMSIKQIMRLNKEHNLNYDKICLTILKELETAQSWYKASLDFLFCEIFVREGNIDEAISAFDKNITKYSGTSMEVENLTRLAVLYADYKKDKDKALALANKAAAINPGQSVLSIAFQSADVKYNPKNYVDRFKGVSENFDNPGEPKEETDIETATDFFSPSPNPFNPVTTMSYTLANPSHVTLTVYNLMGQKVATLVDSYMSAGDHTARFDGSDLASGMYFYRFEAGEVVKTGRMTLVK